MMWIGRRCPWKLVAVALLFPVAVAAVFGSRWLAPVPGSSEDVLARVRVGMSQQEAVAVLQTHNHIDGLAFSGRTKSGQTLGRLHDSFKDLPPPQEIDHGVLTVLDSDGRELEIVLGPGGTVSQKRLTPGVWAYRLEKVGRAVRDRNYYLAKVRHSLAKRAHPIGLGFAAGMVVLSAWKLRHGLARRAGPASRSGALS
jgi:hypothetical protein